MALLLTILTNFSKIDENLIYQIEKVNKNNGIPSAIHRTLNLNNSL